MPIGIFHRKTTVFSRGVFPLFMQWVCLICALIVSEASFVVERSKLDTRKFAMDSSGLQNEISSLFSTKVDIELLSEQKMGFSGASVKEVKLNWEGEATGLPDKLFIKHIILTAPSDDVSEADKTKAERNRLSYINEGT